MGDDSCITLYDTASRIGRPRNPMGSKARFALNFKGIHFKTVWLEYPEIEPTMREIGAAPTFYDNPGSRKWFYTIPVIVDPNHLTPSGEPTVVSDSWAIAEYLEEVYLTPAMLFPSGTKALQWLFHDHFTKSVFNILVPAWTSTFPVFLNDESRLYFRRTREALYKKTLEEVCPKGSTEWDETWDRVQKRYSDIATLLDKNTKGAAFVMEDQVTYVDLVAASVLEMILLVTPEEWKKRSNNGTMVGGECSKKVVQSGPECIKHIQDMWRVHGLAWIQSMRVQLL